MLWFFLHVDETEANTSLSNSLCQLFKLNELVCLIYRSLWLPWALFSNKRDLMIYSIGCGPTSVRVLPFVLRCDKKIKQNAM